MHRCHGPCHSHLMHQWATKTTGRALPARHMHPPHRSSSRHGLQTRRKLADGRHRRLLLLLLWRWLWLLRWRWLGLRLLLLVLRLLRLRLRVLLLLLLLLVPRIGSSLALALTIGRGLLVSGYCSVLTNR
jgi:hypothetical protein